MKLDFFNSHMFSNRFVNTFIRLSFLVGIFLILPFATSPVLASSLNNSAFHPSTTSLPNYPSQVNLLNLSSTAINLAFSTLFGGSGIDSGYSIALDGAHNFYITGKTDSTNFPMKNSFNATYGGNTDAYIAKFNASGSLLFSTYFGGSGYDVATKIAVDSQGNMFLTGYTNSTNFPLKNAYNSTFGGVFDAFVTEFSSTGSLVFSTFLGGNGFDLGDGIAVDKSGFIFVSGSTGSTNFPTKNAFNNTFGGMTDAFLCKFSSTGSLLFSTYIGGKNVDFTYALTLDQADNVYITGVTNSLDFPIKNAFNATHSIYIYHTSSIPIPIPVISHDAFITEFNSLGSLVFSTFLGGFNDNEGVDIAVDAVGNIYLTGSTSQISYSVNGVEKTAPSYFPTKNAIQPSYAGGTSDAFVLKFNSAHELVFSTYFGGSNTDTGDAIATDNQGNCYVLGTTSSNNLTLKDALESNYIGSLSESFVAKFSSTGNLVYSTYFGGTGDTEGNALALDTTGAVYFMGSTDSTDFLTKNTPNSTNHGTYDIFVAEFAPLSTSSNEIPIISPFLNIITSNMIISAFIFTVISLLTIYIGVEYRAYAKNKKSLSIAQQKSFTEFLKQKIGRKNNKLEPNQVSDKTFQMLEEIEKENKPES